jgi:hypothetical protein
MDDVPAALKELERHGLMYVQDAARPSLTTLLVGEPVKGAWWAHPEAHRIFGVYGRLEAHPDVLRVKLLDGKVTLVHRRMMAAVAAVGRSCSPWQLDGLSRDAELLLERVEKEERVATSAKPGKELGERLLVVLGEEHTEKGRHVTVLSSWDAVCRERRIEPLPSVSAAHAAIALAALALPTTSGALPRLPWV